jgi:hypothetical protein
MKNDTAHYHHQCGDTMINDLITRLRHNTRSKLALEAAAALEEAWNENERLNSDDKPCSLCKDMYAALKDINTHCRECGRLIPRP